MKKKLVIIIGLAVAISAVVGLSIGIYEHNKSTDKKVQIQEPKKVVNEKVLQTHIGGNDTNYTYLTTQGMGQYNSYVIPSYIADIEKTNHDTDYFWNTSMENIINELESWNEKYHASDIKTIIDNQANIPSYLIRLAVMHPESIPYVAGYHGYKLNGQINLKGYTKEGKIPLFQEWDKQWGYDWYGNGPIGMDGCGPTSLSMIVVGLTNNLNDNPRVVADYSAKNGGYSWNAGSNQNLFTTVAEHFGLTPHKIDGNQIIQQLKLGRPIMVSCHAGEFTLSGHIIVLTGVTANGDIIINNPDSIKDSMKEWSLNTILDNMNYAYSYSYNKKS